MQTDRTMHFKSDLESESNVTKAAERALATVHDHDGHGSQMLLAAVGLIERIGPRVCFQNQSTTGALPPRLAATILRHGQEHRFLASHALPLDIPVCGVELSLLVDEDFLWQWRKGDIVAPTQGDLDLSH